MRGHAQYQKRPQQPVFTGFKGSNPSCLAGEVDSASSAGTRFDLSRIPPYPKAAARLQTKLAVNAPGDSYEQEADRVAAQVLATSEPPAPIGASRQVQRRAGLQGGQPSAAPASVDRALTAPGKPLEPGLRQDMEQRFGHDFSGVRVHTDTAAAQSARDVNAQAYTVGHDVVFDSGRFTPGNYEGRRLIAHELVHVIQQQRDPRPGVQRQPDTTAKKDDFDFTIGDVAGEQRVFSVLSPSDPIQFLKAFEKRGNRLIEANFKWLNNNLTSYVADAVVADKSIHGNQDQETLSAIGVTILGNSLTAIAGVKASQVGSTILRVINFGGKVATGAVRGIGGLLFFVCASLFQTFVGSLFDKTNEKIIRTAKKVAAEISKVVNDEIIPGVRASASDFAKFMKGLIDYVAAYVLAEEEEEDPAPTAKPTIKSKAKPTETYFSVGEGANKLSFEFDPNVQLTPQKLDTLILDFANAVLAIDAAVPKLESDRSLYQEMAVRNGVFTGRAAEARPATGSVPVKGEKVISTSEKTFSMKNRMVGATNFDVPSNGIVSITASAYYDTDVDVREMNENVRPPSIYEVTLHRGKSAVSVPRQYKVNNEQVSEWHNLEEGQYHLVIERGGNPNFTLEGKLQVVVRQKI
jgi:hypothetical protein